LGHGPEGKRGQKEGFRWAKKEVGHMAGWAAFLLIPLFFLIYASPLFSSVFSETQRERGKGLEDFKTDSIYCLKNISKVCN
jgi:hypothetical protein